MPERTLGEWLRYLEQLHPVEIDLGLARVRVAAENLNLLPYGPDVITVAGTNGKGSVVYSTDAILRAQGKRTGRYTSPHLLRFNERIAVDGEVVSDQQILDAFTAIENTRGEVTLTYFEFATLAAWWIFKEQKVDVAVMEVGLGGRLDAVNLVDADVVVITAIDLDHQHWLGDTVEKIAPEKAAVARPGRPVVLAESSYPATLFSTLQDIAALPLSAGKEWSWSNEAEQLCVQLAGTELSAVFMVPDGLRPANVAAALQASACLLGAAFDVDVAAGALVHLRVPARRQVVQIAERELLLDVAHNPAAMQAMVDYLKARPIKGKTIAALGLMADKDLESMAAALATGVDGACALAIPGIGRAASPEVIWQALDEVGIAIPQGEFSTEAVWAQLLTGSSPGDRLVVCGSFHSVAGIMTLLSLELPSTSDGH
ncbi:MAG: dihydrofolate synthase/folylpolyglutamate synthase [Glaciecola sp.]|jgi:dihydrofolate synthase/folylpolyglutamate synthase|uniref:bifunctional folylpolyglutamate synthase/dihydrofolate synthase n=1 Tax=Congregibacter sp. TaxID=2744308 RepID=UPI0039E4E4C6